MQLPAPLIRLIGDCLRPIEVYNWRPVCRQTHAALAKGNAFIQKFGIAPLKRFLQTDGKKQSNRFHSPEFPFWKYPLRWVNSTASMTIILKDLEIRRIEIRRWRYRMMLSYYVRVTDPDLCALLDFLDREPDWGVSGPRPVHLLPRFHRATQVLQLSVKLDGEYRFGLVDGKEQYGQSTAVTESVESFTFSGVGQSFHTAGAGLISAKIVFNGYTPMEGRSHCLLWITMKESRARDRFGTVITTHGKSERMEVR